MKIKENVKAITMTVVFEGSALNRDEKIGGNIASIKKIARFNTDAKLKTYSYISRESLTHHLKHTLFINPDTLWRLAKVTRQNKVIQFDITKSHVVDCPELDAFGYMFTQGARTAITRKAPVTLTKAIALEPWQGDMQFNANHDMARRSGSSPDPTTKEENQSLYKFSVTIDINRLGRDEWMVADYEKKGDKIIAYFNEKASDIVLSNVEKNIDEDENTCFMIDQNKIYINEGEILFPPINKTAEVAKKKELTIKGKKDDGSSKSKVSSLKFAEDEYEIIDNYMNKGITYYKFMAISDYNEERKELTLSKSITAEIAKSDEISLRADGGNKYIVFNLNEQSRIQRIKDIFSTVVNGIVFSPSGENPGITPKFIVGAALKVPVPIFHSYVDLQGFNDAILDNNYIVDKKIFARNHLGNEQFDVKNAEQIDKLIDYIFEENR